MKLLIAYGSVLAVLAVLDFIWLGFVSRQFYADRIGHLFADTMRVVPIVLFYVLYAGAIVYFAVLPGEGAMEIAMRGALLGFTAYMTYDLVNYATLANWPLSVVFADVLWGVFITGAAALAGGWLM